MTIDRTEMNEPDRRHPSGHQYVIAHGDMQAQISQVGATLRTLVLDGLDVIDGFEPDQRSVDGRGQVLAPWPNRLTDGSYRYGTRDCQAPLNEVDRHDAIHGLVRWLDWSLVAEGPSSVNLSCALRPQPGYEWQLDLDVTYTVDDDGLTVTLRAVNVDQETAPFGAGFHPYLTLNTDSVDRLTLSVPAAEQLDPAGTGRTVQVLATAWDFTRPRPIGPMRLDTAFGNLVRDRDSRAVAGLEDPITGRSVHLWVDEAYRYLMVYTADQVQPPHRRRTSVAIEPMTCPPDAFRTGTDLIELRPGEAWRGAWGIRAR